MKAVMMHIATRPVAVFMAILLGSARVARL
jgi:hypothetical protein